MNLTPLLVLKICVCFWSGRTDNNGNSKVSDEVNGPVIIQNGGQIINNFGELGNLLNHSNKSITSEALQESGKIGLFLEFKSKNELDIFLQYVIRVLKFFAIDISYKTIWTLTLRYGK